MQSLIWVFDLFASSNLGRLTSEKKWQTVGWKYLSQCHIETEREEVGTWADDSPHCSRFRCTIPHSDRLPANCLLMGVSSRRSCNPKCSKQKLSVLGLALAIEIVSQSLHFTSRKSQDTNEKKTKNHFIILEIELFFAFQQLLIIFFLLAAAAADKGNSNSAKDECKANSSSNNNDNSIYLL